MARLHLMRGGVALAGTLLLAGCSASSGTGTSTTSAPASTTTTGPSESSSTTSPATTSTTVAVPAGGAVPAGFVPLSFTSVTLDDWWLLGSADCGASAGGGTDCDAIVRTTDGGQGFAGIPAPPVTVPTVAGLRFANADDGWAYGTELWSTTNGGTTWTRTVTSGPIFDVEASSGEALALVCTTDSEECPTEELLGERVGSSSWTRLTTPVALGAGTTMALSGPDVYIEPGSGSNVFLASDDSGSSFTERTSPCSAGLGGKVAAAANGNNTVFVVCPTGTEAVIEQSPNGGATWSAGAAHVSNDFQLTAGTEADALGWPGPPGVALERTTDAGGSFSPAVTASGQTLWAGFADPERAYAILGTTNSAGTVDEARLYESAVGGGAFGSWELVRIAG